MKKKIVDKPIENMDNQGKLDVGSDNTMSEATSNPPRKRESREEVLMRKRKTRTPMTGGNRLHVPEHIREKYKKDGYVLEIFNDEPGRLESAKKAGWEFVTGDVSTRDRSVGDGEQVGENVSRPVGDGVNGYLMFIEKELHEDDMREEQDRVDASEKPINRAKELKEDMEKDGDGGAYADISQKVTIS